VGETPAEKGQGRHRSGGNLGKANMFRPTGSVENPILKIPQKRLPSVFQGVVGRLSFLV
jgi:hypothetical protein